MTLFLLLCALGSQPAACTPDTAIEVEKFDDVGPLACVSPGLILQTSLIGRGFKGAHPILPDGYPKSMCVKEPPMTAPSSAEGAARMGALQ
jgi:hypothetical protein